jgi:RNA polymerase sigma factor (sigma-70 family)
LALYKNKTHTDPPLKEADLLTAYRKSGDLQLLGELYEPYMPLIYGLCLKYFKDEVQAEDAVMHIFEQLISKLRIHEVTNFKSWLYTLARNHCLMEMRVAGKQSQIPIDNGFMENEPFLHPDNGEKGLEEQLNAMEQCLEKLNEEQQRCIRLFYLDGKCYKEIADITGYEPGKVKSYIQNGKRNLKICMESTTDD